MIYRELCNLALPNPDYFRLNTDMSCAVARLSGMIWFTCPTYLYQNVRIG
jgi:hypothetical protein